MDVEAYLLATDDLEWSQLFASWTWLIPPGTEVEPWLMNRFGDLVWIDASGKINLLNVSDGSNEVVAETEDDFLSSLDDEDNQDDWLMVGLVDELREKTPGPGAGQCHGFRVLPVLGGEYAMDNVYTASVAEYWAFCGEVHRRIDGLPEGAPIAIDVPGRPGIE